MRSAASTGADTPPQSTGTTESAQPAAEVQPEAAQPEADVHPDADAHPEATQPEADAQPAASVKAASTEAGSAEAGGTEPEQPAETDQPAAKTAPSAKKTRAAGKTTSAKKTRSAEKTTSADKTRPAKRKPSGRRSAKRSTAKAAAADVADASAAPKPDVSASGANGAAPAAAPAPAKTDQAAPAKSPAPRKPRRRTTRPRTRYSVGQQIVYPLQGVGQVERLEEREFRNKPTLYYVVYLEVSDMTIMIPVDKADDLGIRAIVSKRKAERALRLIAEDFDPIPTDWKLRYQMNLDLLKRGAVNDIASVVRSLSYRSRIKELPILERKLFDNALRLMVDEVSYSLGRDKGDIESLIEERLANVKQKGDEEVKPKTA